MTTSLTVNLTNGTVSGGAGNDVLISIENIIGGSGSDVIIGSAGDNVLFGGDGNDAINASYGNDILDGGAGNDSLLGDAGDDEIYGDAGNDSLAGGVGNDNLMGGLGNDTYQFGRGDGGDTINEDDSTAGNSDTLVFLSGVNVDQLWFEHVGNDLKISVLGTQDSVTIMSWYVNGSHQVEQLKAYNLAHTATYTLLASNVDALVTAMASVSKPTAATGLNSLTGTDRTTFQTVIDAINLKWTP
jgi:Ca2+-binding RTX toxin-like protein